MAKVKVLPDIIANKIAAGEVVERPASVVKELVENSVDAGASAIVVEIEDGGKRLIRVSDNGTGMSQDDVLLAIERHATSKIESMEDIENIVTLGFRGEALPSIVSVSRAVIDTRRAEDTFGTRLVIEGGVLKQVSDIGRDTGTDVEIKNLFYNLPARRKFLGAETTELKHVRAVLYDYAVAAPGLSLTLIADGRELFSFHGCISRGEMLPYIFGETLADLMVPLKVSVEGTEISGFIGKPDSARASGVNQYIVMNNRPIRSRTISKALIDGYGPTVARGMFPPFVLYFETDPSRVDVNVHPTKREVRIHREFPLLQALREAVAEAIQSMAAVPELTEQRWPFSDYGRKITPVTMYNPPPEHWQNDIPRTPETTIESQTGMKFPAAEHEPAGEKMVSLESYESPSFWQLKDRYIITTIKEGAIIIDQHVAHERILYEETLDHIQGKNAPAQQLLFPLTLDFSAADFDILEQMIPFLNQIGFGVREFGERSIIVDAIPSGMTEFGEGKIFSEFIEEMRIHGKITSGYMDKFAAAVACRAAIKAGKPLNQTEMQYLADRLFATRSPFVCPHGRPTVVKLTIEELDRRFGR
ncbi:MAG: DNA mismatch repair endonuclease MutL [Candidatus Latescibacterota bacterium]